MREALDKFESKIPGKEMNVQAIIKCATNHLKERKYQKTQTEKDFLMNIHHLSMQKKGFV